MAAAEGLSTSTIANPRLWRLGMLLDTEGGTLTATLRSTVGDDAPLCRAIALAPGVPMLQAMEDAVYDNPMLLADFHGRTTLLVRTPRFALLPAALDADNAAEALGLLHTADEADPAVRTFAAEAPGTDAAVACAVAAPVAGFLGRTFAEARVQHELVPLISYFAAKAPGAGNCAKVFAVAEEGRTAYVCFGADGRLLGATAYVCPTAGDAAYYAAALAQVCGVAASDLRFYVAGEASRRDALMAELRRFAPTVMPWIVPAAAEMSADTPFSLSILPLCE